MKRKFTKIHLCLAVGLSVWLSCINCFAEGGLLIKPIENSTPSTLYLIDAQRGGESMFSVSAELNLFVCGDFVRKVEPKELDLYISKLEGLFASGASCDTVFSLAGGKR